MKKIDEFSTEEVGEEWIRELHKVVAQKRNGMFRMLTESVRQLLLGNAGGCALIIGFMRVAAGSDDSSYHWVAILSLLAFAIGTLASALTMILVAAVAVREAHSAEKGLKQFVDGEITRTDVLFTVENQTFRIADMATICGGISIAGFLLGGVVSVLLIAFFF